MNTAKPNNVRKKGLQHYSVSYVAKKKARELGLVLTDPDSDFTLLFDGQRFANCEKDRWRGLMDAGWYYIKRMDWQWHVRFQSRTEWAYDTLEEAAGIMRLCNLTVEMDKAKAQAKAQGVVHGT